MRTGSWRRGSGPTAGADLAAALTRLHRTQQRRGQVIVLSDFLDRGDWSTALRRIALRHQVIAVPILDPRELDLPLTTDRDWLVDIAAFVSSRRGGGRRPVESGAGR